MRAFVGKKLAAALLTKMQGPGNATVMVHFLAYFESRLPYLRQGRVVVAPSPLSLNQIVSKLTANFELREIAPLSIGDCAELCGSRARCLVAIWQKFNITAFHGFHGEIARQL